MNIFDYKGPAFLLAYALLFGAIVGLLTWVRRRLERGPLERIDTSDPYRLAFLHGGLEQVVRTVSVTLVDGGWLAAAGDSLVPHGTATATRPPSTLPTAPPTHPLLQLALAEVTRRRGMVAMELGSHPPIVEWANAVEKEQCAAGLVPGASQKQARLWLGLLGGVVLFLVAARQLQLAAELGHRNTGLLELFRLAAPVACLFILLRPRRTSKGDQLLQGLRTLCDPLRGAPGTPTLQELALLTALFGVTVLDKGRFSWAAGLFPAGSSSSCGGSSCGGGGCGGGGACGG